MSVCRSVGGVRVGLILQNFHLLLALASDTYFLLYKESNVPIQWKYLKNGLPDFNKI